MKLTIETLWERAKEQQALARAMNLPDDLRADIETNFRAMEEIISASKDWTPRMKESFLRGYLYQRNLDSRDSQ